MEKFFHKEAFNNENDYVEYINMYLITALSTLLYTSYGVIFALFTYSNFLFITQLLSIFVCIAAFTANRVLLSPRIATITMILLISSSIICWTYSLDVGNGLRWYAVLALCPLYFFSSMKLRDKVLLSALVLASFLTATFIGYYHEPIAQMPNSDLFNTISSGIIFISIAFELILYQYVNTKKEDELKRIGTILENIECGIIIVDEKTHEILDVNPVAARMYGAEKEIIMGKACHTLICTSEEGACPITDHNLEINREEQMLVDVRGNTVPILKSVAKIWYNNRSALLESFTDVTDLKKAEEKLRLLEITERANHAKSEFLSRMSHEMRTPMNAIIGMTKIAEGTNDAGRLKYCLSTIGVSSTHLLGIINDILDMSKIEAGKFELDNVPLHVEKILMKISSLIIAQTEQKNIKLNIFMGKEVRAQYIGDELRLSQVITNLMSNAVKFTPENGAIRLTVEEVQREAGGSVLRFAVADTGIGMTGAQMERLFNAFEQADGSITRQFGGTGLGLAISKNIVEKMGGRIWAESEPGAGSTFLFEIRLDDAEGKRTQFAYPKSSLPNAKVLVADADAESREYFRDIAGWNGINVDAAEDIAAMILLIKQANEEKSPYDLIFLAYNMQDMNGIDALRLLDVDTDTSAVVMMSSFLTWSKIEETAHNVGINRFIQKPLFPSDILKAISSVTRKPAIGPEIRDACNAAIPEFTGINLLLAEDVKINQEIFIALLEETKIAIDTAENGMEALQKFEEDPDRYDIIVMDIQMPKMNGYEATRRIRSLDMEKAKSIPIIAMSADAFKEDIEKCIACGMNDHLKKPIELDLVMEKLARYCRKA